MMSRTLTLIRPRILTGFMLTFTAQISGQQHILTNGTTALFSIDNEAHILTLSPTNNPNLTPPAPLTIPAGEDDLTAYVRFRSNGGACVWYVELE